jgi:hypothetical protein
MTVMRASPLDHLVVDAWAPDWGCYRIARSAATRLSYASNSASSVWVVQVATPQPRKIMVVRPDVGFEYQRQGHGRPVVWIARNPPPRDGLHALVFD